MSGGRICLGKIIGVHGVRGNLKIKAYTDDPAALGNYGPVSLDDGRQLTLKVKTVTPKGPVIASASEVTDRNDADLLKGMDLFIARDALPAIGSDELYHADLIGMAVSTGDGDEIGTFIGLHDFGAGELAEIRPETGPTFMLPFASAFRGAIDHGRGVVVLNPPPGMLELVRSDESTTKQRKASKTNAGVVRDKGQAG